MNTKLFVLATIATVASSAEVSPRRAAFVSSPNHHRIGSLSTAPIKKISSIHNQRTRSSTKPNNPITTTTTSSSSSTTTTATTTTSLSMGYNLPPSPPSPKGPLDDLQSILPTIATGALVALFFASPLGAAFFAIFNSLFLLTILTPFILFAGFQIWSALYTVEAPCPSCGRLNVRAIKNEERDPTVCLNCGALSRVNEKGDGLELCNNPYDMMNQDVDGSMGGSLFDQLFGMGGGGGSGGMMGDFGSFDGGVNGNVAGKGKDDPVKRAKRQNTIIDVDVERDD